MIKGLRPHGGWRSGLLVALGAIGLFSLGGYLDAIRFGRQSGALEIVHFRLDAGTVIFAALICVCWLISCLMLFKSKEEVDIKWGGIFIVSSPFLIFLLLSYKVFNLGYFEF